MPPGDDVARARLLVDAGRPAEAVEGLARHLAAEPEDVEAWLLMSAAQVEQGQGHQSLASAERATRLAPDDDRAHSARGAALLAQRRNTEAHLAYGEAIRISPASYQHWHNRALAAQRAGGLRGEALADVDRAIELAPFSAGSYLLRGVVLSELGRKKEASRATRKALELDPSNALAHNNSAVESLQKRRVGSAAAALNRAISADPQDRLVQGNLDVLIIKVARRLFFIGAAVSIVAALGAFEAWPAAVRHLGGPVAVLLAFGFGLAPLRRLSPGARRHLGHRVRRDPFLLYACFVAVFSAAYALVESELSDSAGVGLAHFLRVFLLVNLIYAAWGRRWVAERRREDARL